MVRLYRPTAFCESTFLGNPFPSIAPLEERRQELLKAWIREQASAKPHDLQFLNLRGGTRLNRNRLD